MSYAPSLSTKPAFRDVVADLRSRKSLTQEQLAAELKVSFATVNRWETGKTVPDTATLHRLAEFARKQGNDVSDLADRLDAGGFAVPAKSRRNSRKAIEENDGSVVLDVKSMETMLWKAACSIRGEKDAPKFKDYILPLLFIKRLSDVFEDEVAILTRTYDKEALAREVLEADHSLVRFFVPPFATWPVISGRQPYDWPDNDKPKTLGERLTTATRAIARENKTLQGVIDIVDFNETRNGEREVSDEALSGVIEIFSQPRYRLGLHNVEPDFLGRAYEYLLRKFAEGQGQSAGEFFTPKEVGWLIAYLVKPQQGEEVYDPTCGSAGLLVKCELALLEQEKAAGREVKRPLKLYGQELTGSSYAIGRMNMVLHDMEGEIVRGNTMTNPKFLDGAGLKKFDIVVANPMWNQNNFSAKDVYEADTFDRFAGGTPPESSADWGWLQHIAASLKEGGRAAIVLDTGAVSRGSGNQGENKEKVIRRWFVEQNLIDAVVLLPDNLFYNTSAAGVIIVLRRGRAADEPVVLINASAKFQKGRPKNYLTDENVQVIAATLRGRVDVNQYAAAIPRDSVRAKDFNLSPATFIQTDVDVVRRDLQDIINDLHGFEVSQAEAMSALRNMFRELGYGWENVS
jgi:type I restriction enzyme M protein